MKNITIIACLLLFHPVSNLTAQQIVNHHASFNSGQQNMWGPSFSPITLDQTITLFDESWNTSFDTGNSGIFTIAGQDFGGAFSGNFNGRVGSEIRIEGFTTGTVEVDYPVNIELDMPNDLSYDQGDNVTIQTDYTVESGWDLETLYPSVGEFFWDFYFQMGASAEARICAFGCTAFTIIPTFNTGLQTLNLVTVSGSGASTGGSTGVWYLGPGDPLGPDGPGVGGWPYSKPPGNAAGSLGTDWIPWQVNLGAFPAALPDTDFGLSGEITIPYVETTQNLNTVNRSIRACGDSTYFNLNLEIFKLLGKILSVSPPPLPAAAPFFSNLSGSESYGIAEFNWNFFSASFDANITNNQCFDFTPKIYGKFEFPVAVDYSITNLSGVTSAVQQSSIINLEIGEALNYKFPCYFEEVNITPTYSIDGQFRNHTYDEVSFDFLMSAFEFGFNVPAVTVIPGFTIPRICIPYGYPCGFIDWCTGQACTPAIVVPPIGFSGWSLTVGPLWETSLPLGSFSYDWFDDTWGLEGFQDTTFAPFKMIANRITLDAIASDVDCWGGSNGDVVVNVSAVSDALPYTYQWTNGTNIIGANVSSITSLPAGDYEVSLTDNNGCQIFNGATVKEPLKLVVNYTKTNKSCALGVNDGSIDVSVRGGTGAYSYLWSNGATSQDISALDIGSYSLTVTDINGCQESIVVEIEQPFALTHSAFVSDVDCNGSSTGSIDVNVVGGTLPYAYTWSSGQITEDINSVPAGNYIFTVTDQNGCISTNSYNVVQPAQPIGLTESSIDVSCYNGTNGSIDVQVIGGTPPYNYQWFSDASGMLSFNGEDPSGLTADTYRLVVYDQNRCSNTISITINQPSAPLSDNEVITNINCFGNSTGEIDPQITGGTAPYTYNWSNGSASPILSNVPASSYTLILTDDNGCTATFNYTISEPVRPLTIVTTQTDVLCHGDATGKGFANITGGTAPYTINWSNGASTQDISSLVAGSYTVNVTDALGCVESETIVIIEPVAPIAISSIITDVLCYEGNDGGIDVNVTGGTTPYSYQWSDGLTYIYADTTQDLTNITADQYLLIVTDDNQCVDSLTSTVNQPAAPLNVTYTVIDVDCFGTTSGAIDVNVTGGTVNYSYAWSNGSTSEDLTAIAAGTYTLTVIDQNGCQIQTTVLVKEPNAPLLVTTSSEDVNCFGNATGKIISNVSGGTTNYTYNWSNGATTPNISALTAGVYTVTITDNNGCTAFSGATINEPLLLDVTAIITDPSCYGYDNGEVELVITGGIQPYYFNWGNQEEILLNNPSETIDSIPTGEYFLRVTDENGCKYEEVVFVDEPNPYTFQAFITDVTCFEGADGVIDLTLTGGTTPYNVEWSNGVIAEDVQNLTAGNYSFVALDDQGCIIRDNLNVNEPNEIGIAYDMVLVSCVDQNDAAIYISPFGGTAPYSYAWSNNTFEQNLEEVAPGFYQLTITDINNCENNFDFDILTNDVECVGIPNTFTPNGDLYNDSWIIENLYLYPNNTVKVFNKWGNEIFSSTGEYDPWDGTDNGKALPAGVYYYVVILGNEEGNKYTGNLTIVR
jgi:gliding motility-associated-like protein